MKKYIILITLLFSLLNLVKGQNTFFIGEKTYPSTSTFTLKSNKNLDGYDLDVAIIKSGNSGIIAVSTSQISGVRIKGKLLIYLDNNNLITCIDRGKFDNVNGVSTTLYYLSKEEIIKMIESNINTIRFTLRCYKCAISTEEGNYSAKCRKQRIF